MRSRKFVRAVAIFLAVFRPNPYEKLNAKARENARNVET
jgi:hypothetical protein